jgi:hypothetical protein
MRKLGFPLSLVILLSVLSWPWVFAQDPKNPSTLDEYHFVARGKMSRDRLARPRQIARMDNNGEILFACVEEKTVDQLESSGIEFRKSQLELLFDWNLIEYDGESKTYKTTVHVYGNEESSAIRRLVGKTVEQLAIELEPELISLKSHLETIGRDKSLFAVLYSYVLHNYSMEQFGEEIYRKPQLSAENPFWNGYAWAIYPIKRFDVGTSFMPMEGCRFFGVFSDAVPGPRFRQLIPFAENVATDNKLDDPELQKSFSTFDLFNEQGELTIPVFEGEWSARLENMAKNTYARTVDLVDSKEMKEILGMETRAQAAMFLHYEIRYAFLSHMLEKGAIEAPIDFANAENNSPADMGNLLFLIKSVQSEK